LRKQKAEPPTFRAPGGPALAIVGILFGVWLLSTRRLEQAWLLPLVVAAGGVLWIAMRKHRTQPVTTTD